VLDIGAIIVLPDHLLNHKASKLHISVVVVQVLLKLGMISPQPPLTIQANIGRLAHVLVKAPPSLNLLRAMLTSECHTVDLRD
jgi:hypothetical protein